MRASNLCWMVKLWCTLIILSWSKLRQCHSQWRVLHKNSGFFFGGGVRFCMQDLEDAALCTVVKFLQDGYDLVIFDKLITFWGSSKFRPSDS